LWKALDQVMGPDASRIKRGEHSFANPGQLESLLRDAGFGAVVVSTVHQTIVFPSVLDYVRFQLVATPMTMLLKDKTEPERQAIISSVASTTATLSTSSMLDGGKFAFLQEAYVAIARPPDYRLIALSRLRAMSAFRPYVGRTEISRLAASCVRDLDQFTLY
jgi:hypothetical protein